MATIIKGSGTGKSGPAAGCLTCEAYQDLPCGSSKLAIVWSGSNLGQGVRITGLGTTYGYNYLGGGAILCGSGTYFSPDALNSLVNNIYDCSGTMYVTDFMIIMLVDIWAAYAASVWSSSVSLGIYIDGDSTSPTAVVRCGWVNPTGPGGYLILSQQGVCKARAVTAWANTCASIIDLAGTLTVMDDGTLSIV